MARGSLKCGRCVQLSRGDDTRWSISITSRGDGLSVPVCAFDRAWLRAQGYDGAMDALQQDWREVRVR